MQKIDLVDISRLDFNLAVTFLAIWQERSVSVAANRLSLSQSAVSSALARLREIAGDPLFIRVRGVMQPTPRAERMAGAINQGTGLLRDAFLASQAFEPASSTRRFTIGMSDDFQLALGPGIAKIVAGEAPNMTLGFRQSNRKTVETMIANGEIDMAVVAGWPRRSAFESTVLAEGDYACLLDPVACDIGSALTLDSFLSLPHVLVSFSGREGIVDEALQAMKKSRKIQLSLTHFAALPVFLTGVKAISTLPSHAAAQLASFTRLAMMPVPMKLGTYTVSLVWRRDFSADEAHSWVRSRIETVIGQNLRPAGSAPDAIKP